MQQVLLNLSTCEFASDWRRWDVFFCFFLPGCFRHWKTSLPLCPWIAAELEREARISDLKASISNPLDKVGFAINTWWKTRGFKDGIPFLEDAKSQLGQLFPRPDSSYHFYLTLFYFSGLFFFQNPSYADPHVTYTERGCNNTPKVCPRNLFNQQRPNYLVDTGQGLLRYWGILLTSNSLAWDLTCIS